MANKLVLKVPLKMHGVTIGSAMIGPHGEIFADVDASMLGMEMREALLAGLTDGLSISPLVALPSTEEK